MRTAHALAQEARRQHLRAQLRARRASCLSTEARALGRRAICNSTAGGERSTRRGEDDGMTQRQALWPSSVAGALYLAPSRWSFVATCLNTDIAFEVSLMLE